MSIFCNRSNIYLYIEPKNFKDNKFGSHKKLSLPIEKKFASTSICHSYSPYFPLDDTKEEIQSTSLRRDKNSEFQPVDDFGIKASPEFKTFVAKKLSDVIER